MPAVDNRAAVNLEYVTIFEFIVAGETVNHFVVYRGTDGCREAVVTQEVTGSSVAFENLREDRVD